MGYRFAMGKASAGRGKKASAAASQLLFPVVGEFPLRGHDLSFVLPLTGKPAAPGTKTQIRP